MWYYITFVHRTAVYVIMDTLFCSVLGFLKLLSSENKLYYLFIHCINYEISFRNALKDVLDVFFFSWFIMSQFIFGGYHQY